MPDPDFIERLERKVTEQLNSQRVGYLLGAGCSHLDGQGYPLYSELWDLIRDRIVDSVKRAEIQGKLDGGATGIEQALDLLDDGGALDTPYRHLVTRAIAELFVSRTPGLDVHLALVRRLASRSDACIKVFSLNYDPLIERAAEAAKVRIVDGFLGAEHAFFDSAVFEEQIGRIRGSHRGRQFDVTARPIHLFKLHGSLGWYERSGGDARRCAFCAELPADSKRLMVPPQRRKATDTMLPPYAALWMNFRGSLGQFENPLNRLVCIGYGFGDEHVNAVIEVALARSNFNLLIFARQLSDRAWSRWCDRTNVVIVTESRSSLKGEVGAGHPDLWSFVRLAKEV